MKITSKYSKSFYTKDLNETKYARLLKKAEAIRDFKNSISLVIHNDVYAYLDKSRYNLVNQFNTKLPNLTGQDINRHR